LHFACQSDTFFEIPFQIPPVIPLFSRVGLSVAAGAILVGGIFALPAVAGSAGRIIVTPRFDTAMVQRYPGLSQRVIKGPKVGLVFSGGGARGLAQVGVLKSLEKHHIPVDFIAATSIGAVVGGLYASGWTVAEIESVATSLNWDDLTSLTDEVKRTDLFVDQRLSGERSFLTVRFQGLEPVIPSAVSRGQRLTNALYALTLQSLYHPSPSFDDLRIPFRAVSTDLVTGRRIVLDRGSLAEALRASATVPLLFTPIERDSLRLVDGGLVDNIPVDVAEEAGCDLVIVVNSTSGLRGLDQLKAPWEVADQIMGIMMQRVKEQQLRMADLVITPDLGGHLSTDFTGLDTLILRGEQAADAQAKRILRLIEEEKFRFVDITGQPAALSLPRAVVAFSGGGIPESLRTHIAGEAMIREVTLQDVQEHVNILYETGEFADVTGDVEADATPIRITYRCVERPRIDSLALSGISVLSPSEVEAELRCLRGSRANSSRVEDALEDALRLYRRRGYSLARIDSAWLDAASGVLSVVFNEGRIGSLTVEGGIRTRDSYVLSEFPLEPGMVFQIDKARQGLTNLNSSGLFEYVYLDVTQRQQAMLTIRLRERPSQLVRLGLRADSERKLQGSVDIRDQNFQGSASELGLLLLGGERNREVVLDYRMRRLFNTSLILGATAFLSSWDSYRYTDGPPPAENRWERLQVGEYRELRYGGSLSFGTQLGKLGNASLDFVVEQGRVKDLSQSQDLEEEYLATVVRLGTVLDTKDKYYFSTTGVGLRLSYEFALESLGGSVGYNVVRVGYETFSSLSSRLTFHPRLQLGFADKTMPLAQQFRMGGRDSFFGLREDDRRGRQVLLVSAELRYASPVRIVFDTYFRLRYDLGTISAVPEELKFKNFIHGIGGEIAFDTPIGPAMFGAGKAFFLSRSLPENPLQQGPLLFYFSLGYQL
jgi:NTE family protein